MIEQTILVTGASSGIGKAIAEELAKEGYQNLILTCHTSKEALLETATALTHNYGVNCFPFVGDMGDYETVSSLFAMIKERFDTLDVVINNAGISHIGLLSDMHVEEWNRLIHTNLSSLFHSSKFAIPLMLQKHAGKIINISSVWGISGASCEVAYSASKGGMNAFTKALAKELAPSNIQVNAIACGAIDTRMNHFLEKEDALALIEEIPSNRLGTPQEVAKMVLLLINSPSYLTGQIIPLDGGWI